MRLPNQPEALTSTRRAPATRDVCAVCCKPTGPLQALASRERDKTTCTDPFCRGVMTQAANMTASHFRIFLDSQRELIRKRDLAAAKDRRWREKLESREGAEHREILRRFSLAHPDSPPGDVLLQEIPAGKAALAALTPERIESYRCHLETVIAEATALLHRGPDANQGREPPLRDNPGTSERCGKLEARFRQQPGLRATCENLCRLCGGACCSGGKTKAYISADTIMRILRRRPGITPGEILADYLSHLQSETVADSCVNHTGRGCSLPRDLRSDTCNGFFCDSVISYHNAAEYRSDPGKVLAVQRARNLTQRYARDADRRIVKIVLVDSEGMSAVDVDHTDIEKIGAEETCESDNPMQ